jgi:hypothetical protein
MALQTIWGCFGKGMLYLSAWWEEAHEELVNMASLQSPVRHATMREKPWQITQTYLAERKKYMQVAATAASLPMA